MSHITLAQQGIAAAEASDWDNAITKLSTALQSSTNPQWLLTRSRVFIMRNRYQEALDDANLAWHTAYERNKRPLLVEAHYRRAVAYFRLGQYANADCCCIYAMRLIKGFPALEKEDISKLYSDEKSFWTQTVQDATTEAKTDQINKRDDGGIGEAMAGDQNPQAKEWRRASTLRIQILTAMEKLPADDEARKVTVSLKPEQKKLADAAPPKTEEKKPAPVTVPVQAPKPMVPADTPLRLQDFQSTTNMSVSIFSKGTNKDKLKVEFSPTSVRLDPVVYPNGGEKEFVLDTWGEIDVEKSKYTVTPNKVELSLAKKTPGKWAQLKSDGTVKQPTAPSYVRLSIIKESPLTPYSEPTKPAEDKSKGPAYPTSSKGGPKNWDKLEDAGSDDDSDVNKFFKQLYKGATPDQQRAMMKSFTESNGTSLSTDWSDVGNRKVETVPPEGVDAKKW